MSRVSVDSQEVGTWRLARRRSDSCCVISRSVPLEAADARRVYDRIGRLQDTQRFYEDPPVRRAIELAAFEQSKAVFELGCGTGRLAAQLLTSQLSVSTTYVGVDVSPKMVKFARRRLAPWSKQADVQLLELPALELPGEKRSVDRFLSAYVFDLLPPDDACALMKEAGRLLSPEGLLVLVSFTHGTTPVSRLISAGWNKVATHWPALVGGCRPIELRDLISGPEWHIQHAEVAVSYGVPSEVVVATLAPH